MKMDQQQQQQRAADASVSIKATFVPTNENRLIALPAPLSYALLVDKLAALFAINSASDVRVHCVDGETDRVDIASSDELTCALSLAPVGRALRLFVSVADSGAAKATRRMRERNQGQPDVAKAEARQAQREARTSARLAARLARHERNKHSKRTAVNESKDNGSSRDQSQRKTTPAEPATMICTDSRTTNSIAGQHQADAGGHESHVWWGW